MKKTIIIVVIVVVVLAIAAFVFMGIKKKKEAAEKANLKPGGVSSEPKKSASFLDSLKTAKPASEGDSGTGRKKPLMGPPAPEA